MSWVSNWCLISIPTHTQTHTAKERKYVVMTLNIRDRNKENNKSDRGRAEDKEKDAGRINTVCSHRRPET